jgi:hypothetical protein
MGCACYYDEPAEFYHTSHHTAANRYACCECGRTIAPGERYLKITGKWDGVISAYKRCSHCDAVAEALKSRAPCFCDYVRGLWEIIPNGDYIRSLLEAGTGDGFAVLRLIAKAKQAKLQQRDRND